MGVVRVCSFHAKSQNQINRNNSLEPGDQAPRQREEHVRDIIWLPHNSEPAIHQDSVSSIRLDGLGVLDDNPRDLRECVALDKLAPLLLAERVLLPVGRVPHPVHEEIYDDEAG